MDKALSWIIGIVKYSIIGFFLWALIFMIFSLYSKLADLVGGL